jgi:hypothetical protein
MQCSNQTFARPRLPPLKFDDTDVMEARPTAGTRRRLAVALVDIFRPKWRHTHDWVRIEAGGGFLR